MTREEKVAQLGSHWVFQLADGDGAPGAGAPPQRARPRHPHLGRERLRSEQAAELANDDPAPPRRGDAARDPGDRARGDLLRPDGARRDGLPAGNRPREHVGPRARRGARGRGPDQMRAVGAHQGLGPVLDVCRDPRWGRTEETFGEDPYLVARMGVAFVLGLQGNAPGRRDRDGEALRRLRRLRRRDELGSRADSAARAARGLSPPVRGRGPRSPASAR